MIENLSVIVNHSISWIDGPAWGIALVVLWGVLFVRGAFQHG